MEWWRAPGGRASLPDLGVSPQVEILEGKDAGKQGRVVQVIRQRNWVVLEGLNTVRGVGRGLGKPVPPVPLWQHGGVVMSNRLAGGMVRQVNLPFSSMGWMLQDALGQSPSHPWFLTPSLLDSISATSAGPRTSGEP